VNDTTLCCAVCLYDGNDAAANDAATVVEGYAVCFDHLGFVAQGQRFAGIVRTAREQPITRPAVDDEPEAKA
jgi:hypothetical protein